MPDLLGPGIQSLVKMMPSLAHMLAEAIQWTIIIRSLLAIHFAAHEELWTLLYHRSTEFLVRVEYDKLQPIPKYQTRELESFVEPFIQEARFFAFPAYPKNRSGTLNWDLIYSTVDVHHILIPLQLAPTKGDPSSMKEALLAGRVLPEEPPFALVSTDILATRSTGKLVGYADSPSLKHDLRGLKQRIADYETSLKHLAKKREKHGLRAKPAPEQLAPCHRWVDIT
jgi:hypothetical protein